MAGSLMGPQVHACRHMDPFSTGSLSSLVSLPCSVPCFVSQVLIALGRFLKCNVFLYFSCIFILFFLLYFFFFFNLHVILLMIPQRPISQVTFFLGLYVTPSLSIFLSIINSFYLYSPRDHVHSSITALIMELNL